MIGISVVPGMTPQKPALTKKNFHVAHILMNTNAKKSLTVITTRKIINVRTLLVVKKFLSQMLSTVGTLNQVVYIINPLINVQSLSVQNSLKMNVLVNMSVTYQIINVQNIHVLITINSSVLPKIDVL